MVGLRPGQLQAEQPGEKQPELFDIHVLEFGLDAEQVAAGLCGIFGVDPDAARQIALNTPVVVRRASSPDEADRFLDALKPLGAVTVLLPSKEGVARVAQQKAADAVPFQAGDGATAPLGRVALKGSDAESQANAAALEWDPLPEGEVLTSATLSLPRAPPPLLTRQANRESEIEAPPPLLELAERSEVSAPSGQVAPEPVDLFGAADSISFDAGLSIGDTDIGIDGLSKGERGGVLHREAMLDISGAGTLELELDVHAPGNARLPLQLGPSISLPPAHGAPPPTPGRARPSDAAKDSDGGLPPLFGMLPDLPSLPPLPSLPAAALPSRSVTPPMPPAAALRTGTGLLPPPAPPQGLTLPSLGPAAPLGGKPNAHDLRRELAANRFAMGNGAPERGAAPGITAFADAGLELDGPARKPTRRQVEPKPLSFAGDSAGRSETGLGRSPGTDPERSVVRDVAAPGEPAPQRKAAAQQRIATPARSAREAQAIEPGLPLLVGLAVLGVGLYLDRSVLYGNARGPWFLVDAFGVSGVLWAALGAFKATRGRWVAVLVSVGAAYAVNVYAKPLVGRDMDATEASTRTGEVTVGEGSERKEFPVVNAHLLVADAQGLLRSYQVRELALRGVVVGGGEPDVVLYIEMQDPAGVDLRTLTPDMKHFVGKELRVRSDNSMQDDHSRVAWSGAAKPERVVDGWAVMTEALPFDDGRGGSPSWRVAGNLELEILSDDGVRSQVRGRFGARAFWDVD